MTTVHHSTGDLAATPRRPRRIHINTLDDYLELGGSAVGSLAIVDLAFFHLFNFSGLVGFLIGWYVVFLFVYGAVVAATNPPTQVVDRLVTTSLYVVAMVVVGALASAVIFTIVKGWSALHHASFLTHDMSAVSPTAPLSHGGILAAIVGTVVEVGAAVVISLPLGLATAVYMSEVGGRWSNLVRTVVEAMTALPEILAGLFVYVTLVVGMGFAKSGFAVAVAMAITMIPIIARAGEVALRIVPSGLREASAALGASQWTTTWKVVLPSAEAGLATALILAVARGIGETAIPLLVSGASSFTNVNLFQNPMNSLPLFIYTAYQTHEPAALARGFGAAGVLLALVLALFILTRVVSRGRRGGQR